MATNRRAVKHTRVPHPQGNYVDGYGRRWWIIPDTDTRIFQGTIKLDSYAPPEVLIYPWEGISEVKYAQKYQLTEDGWGIEDAGLCCADVIEGSGLENPGGGGGGGGPFFITDGVTTEQVNTGSPGDTITFTSDDGSVVPEVRAVDTVNLQVADITVSDGSNTAGVKPTETLQFKSDDTSVTITVAEGSPNTVDLSAPTATYDFTVDDEAANIQTVENADTLQFRSADDSILPTISDDGGNPNVDIIQQGPVLYFEERFTSRSPGGFTSDLLVNFFLNNGGNLVTDSITVKVIIEEPSLSNKTSWVTADILPASPAFTETSAALLTFDPVTIAAGSYLEFQVGVDVTDNNTPFKMLVLMEAPGMAATHSIIAL